MKKPNEEGLNSAIDDVDDDDMLPEYDFSGGVRGKYAAEMAKGSNLVLLDPDVWAAFPDSESVNRALRLLIEIAQREPAERALAEERGEYDAK